ncbi:hypothetical protein CSAL01_06781 [Colletotrichum salicis]|uniref:Phosphatidylethanolamine-binding protein n=1 Tax=Colletotrichum salicis TaxID=1209931 RepID=A0A135RUQ4_9PEZI|nr:hypothetical protein CSAL01_06781 [Colletotrichum salicis]
MKSIISITALLAAVAIAHNDMPPRSMSTTEFRQAFMEAGIVPDIGPDSPTRESPTERNMRHYLAGNFTLEQTKSEVLASAMIMKNSTPAFNDYMAPEPKAGSGMHRYVYLLYVQPEKLNKMGFDAMGVDKMNRKNFNVSNFPKPSVSDSKLTCPRSRSSANKLA